MMEVYMSKSQKSFDDYKMPHKLRSAYVLHARRKYVSEQPSRTRQEFADECDINVLMDRFKKTGVISHVRSQPARYFDATDVPDLQTAMNTMNDAQAAFMSLPAKVRKEFDNDAAKFVEYALNKDNLDKMREWGLAPPPEAEPKPQKVEIVNQPASAPVPLNTVSP